MRLGVWFYAYMKDLLVCVFICCVHNALHFLSIIIMFNFHLDMKGIDGIIK